MREDLSDWSAKRKATHRQWFSGTGIKDLLTVNILQYPQRGDTSDQSSLTPYLFLRLRILSSPLNIGNVL